MAVSCKSCKYFKDTTCRRYPPIFNSIGMCMMFPGVSDSDWCGEYKRKPKKDESAETRETPKTTPKKDMDAVIEVYMREFRRKTGSKPYLQQKDYAAVKRMIEQRGVDDAVKIVQLFFTHTPKWYKENRRYSVSDISSATNSVLATNIKNSGSSMLPFLDNQAQVSKDHPMFKTRAWFDYIDSVKKSGKEVTFADYVSDLKGDDDGTISERD